MVEHGADIHIEYEDVNILTPAWGTSTATIEFLLSEYKFSNEEMLKALNCTDWQGNTVFISLKELFLFQKHGLKLDAKTAETANKARTAIASLFIALFMLTSKKVFTVIFLIITINFCSLMGRGYKKDFDVNDNLFLQPMTQLC